MPQSAFTVREVNGYQYLDEGPASDLPPVVLLHGMMGDLSNWTRTVDALVQNQYRVLVPVLPVYDLPLKQTNVTGLVRHVQGFLDTLEIDAFVLAGNSLGGHVAILYTLEHPDAVLALMLSGSSGIYEVTLGTSVMRRQDRDFIRSRAAITFYDPVHATDELVEDIYGIVNNRNRALRLIKMARAVEAQPVTERLGEIQVPTLLVWGRDDTITPPDVAETFKARLQHAELHFIAQCGHAPMIEHPDNFNQLTLDFLRRTIGTAEAVVS